MKNKKVRILAVTIGATMLAGTAAAFAGCNGDNADYLVIMTENLEGLFNPFYASAAPDVDVVGMTQISMLTTEYKLNPATGIFSTSRKGTRRNICSCSKTALHFPTESLLR